MVQKMVTVDDFYALLDNYHGRQVSLIHVTKTINGLSGEEILAEGQAANIKCFFIRFMQNWDYKKDKEVFKRVLATIKSKNVLDDKIMLKIEESINPDDYLDAYVAWKLGVEWINNNGNVEILGDENTGSFLLPFNKEVFEKFSQFKIK